MGRELRLNKEKIAVALSVIIAATVLRGIGALSESTLVALIAPIIGFFFGRWRETNGDKS